MSQHLLPPFPKLNYHVSHVYTYSSDGKLKHKHSPSKYNKHVIAWGLGPSSSHLFATSESETDDTGIHSAFDVRTSKLLYKFSATENGESMGVDSYGTSVRLASLLPLI